jgi:hypothetical protein
MAALNGKIVLFGGIGSGNLTDTWEYDGASWTNKAIPYPTMLHGIRTYTAMAPLNGKIVLFSGELDANNVPPDTWEYDGASWTQKNVSGPPGRWHHGMTTFAGSILLFGGDTGTGTILGDTWTWDGAGWKQYAGQAPGARYTYTLAAR